MLCWFWIKPPASDMAWKILKKSCSRAWQYQVQLLKFFWCFFWKPQFQIYILWKSLGCVQLFATPQTIVHGILQARILKWVAFPFPRVSSQPSDWTQVSHIAGRFFPCWVTREAQYFVAGALETTVKKNSNHQSGQCIIVINIISMEWDRIPNIVMVL